MHVIIIIIFFYVCILYFVSHKFGNFVLIPHMQCVLTFCCQTLWYPFLSLMNSLCVSLWINLYIKTKQRIRSSGNLIHLRNTQLINYLFHLACMPFLVYNDNNEYANPNLLIQQIISLILMFPYTVK